MAQGIYAITHVLSGKRYVGSSKNLRRRRWEHFRALLRGTHKNPHLQRAFALYGEAAFLWEVLELVVEVEHLLPREQVWLDRLQAYQRTHGYNLTPTAGSNRGCKPSPETIAKRVAALTGKKRTLSPEALERLVTMNKTRTRSDEERAASGARMLAGRDTPIYRDKLSRGRRGKVHTQEALDKMSEAKRGKPRTRSEKLKISEALKGRPKSEETRQRMREAAQRRVSGKR